MIDMKVLTTLVRGILFELQNFNGDRLNGIEVKKYDEAISLTFYGRQGGEFVEERLNDLQLPIITQFKDKGNLGQVLIVMIDDLGEGKR